MSYYNQNRVKSIIIAILVVALMATGMVLCLKIIREKQAGKVQVSAYAVGTLTDSQGKYAENYSNIYTKNFIDAKNVSFELEEDSNITYKVFYYDKDKDFLGHSSALSADSNDSTFDEGTKYIKVVIITQDPEVVESEISKYASRLTINLD